MIRVLSVLLLAGLPAVAEDALRPPVPDWQSYATCTWQWREGGGFGLWTERCEISTGDFACWRQAALAPMRLAPSRPRHCGRCPRR